VQTRNCPPTTGNPAWETVVSSWYSDDVNSPPVDDIVRLKSGDGPGPRAFLSDPMILSRAESTAPVLLRSRGVTGLGRSGTLVGQMGWGIQKG
jgi:hypothetical protein